MRRPFATLRGRWCLVGQLLQDKTEGDCNRLMLQRFSLSEELLAIFVHPVAETVGVGGQGDLGTPSD